tara:strand:+ start:459 stop:596 length:138 start_codon:yes stop_codon:yes gene_type:complete
LVGQEAVIVYKGKKALKYIKIELHEKKILEVPMQNLLGVIIKGGL